MRKRCLILVAALLLCSSVRAEQQAFELDVFINAPCSDRVPPALESGITQHLSTIVRAKRGSIAITTSCMTIEEWEADIRTLLGIATPPESAKSAYIAKVAYDGPPGSADRIIGDAFKSGACRSIKYICNNVRRAEPMRRVLSGAVHSGALRPPLLGTGGPPTNIIKTVAGTGVKGVAKNGTVATLTPLNNPNGVATDAAGNLYIADAPTHTIKIVRPDGKMYVFAGREGIKSGVYASAGDGGPATAALLNTPRGVAVDPADGSVYIADSLNHRIRRVDSKGIITLFAGTGTPNGNPGDGGPATAASLTNPRFIAFDATSVYWSDVDSFRVRKVDKATRIISTVAGTGVAGVGVLGEPADKQPVSSVRGVAVSPAGVLHLSDTGNHRVLALGANSSLVKVAGTGSPGLDVGVTAAQDTRLASPFGLAFDAAGTLYIADVDNNLIRWVKDGVIGNFAGNTFFGYSGDGGAATSTRIYNAQAIAIDATLKVATTPLVYLADSSNFRIRAVTGLADTSITVPDNNGTTNGTTNGTDVLP